MLDFKPPINNRVWMAICKWGLPLETVIRSRISVKVVGDGLARFQQLQGKHAVVVCNHSDQYDPEVMFTFSKLAGEDFYFIAAREVFDWFWGLTGLFFQNLGVYSVVRGEADMTSFRTTRGIISGGTKKLVMFPEGEVTRQPDVVLPLRPGVMRLFLEGEEDLLQREPDEPVYVQPMAIRWRYKGDITGKLAHSLSGIEKKLGIRPRSQSLIVRVHDAAAAMLSVLEQEYGLHCRDDLSFEQRVRAFRAGLLQQIAAVVNVELPADESQMGWLRRLQKELQMFIKRDMTGCSVFEKRIHHRQVWKLKRLMDDVHLVQHLIGVREHPADRPMTQERLAYIVNKIEREVVGYVVPKGARVALIDVGEPFSLLDFYPQYRSDKTAAIEGATAFMRERLQELVDRLDGKAEQALVTTRQSRSAAS